MREQSGSGTTGASGYHIAANTVANDDAINNMEATLNNELGHIHAAHNAKHQATFASIAELRAVVAAAQQQFSLLAVAPTPPHTTFPLDGPKHGPPTPGAAVRPPFPPCLTTMQQQIPQWTSFIPPRGRLRPNDHHPAWSSPARHSPGTSDYGLIRQASAQPQQILQQPQLLLLMWL